MTLDLYNNRRLGKFFEADIPRIADALEKIADSLKDTKKSQITTQTQNSHGSLRDFPNCPDCGVKPGQPHEDGCDVERCSACSYQRLSCGCDDSAHDKLFARWTGIWPGYAESKYLGCKDLNEFQIKYAGLFFKKPTSRQSE